MVIYIAFEGEGSSYYTEEPKPRDNAENQIPKVEDAHLQVPPLGANAGMNVLFPYFILAKIYCIHEANTLSCYVGINKDKHLSWHFFLIFSNYTYIFSYWI